MTSNDQLEKRMANQFDCVSARLDRHEKSISALFGALGGMGLIILAVVCAIVVIK